MEKNSEEISANEKIRSAEFRRRDCHVSPTSDELDGCSSVAPPRSCMPSSSVWPRSSTFTNLDRANCSLKNNELSLSESMPTLTSPYPMNDAGFTVEDVVARNYGYSNTRVVGCSNAKEGNSDLRTSLPELEWRGFQSRIAHEELMSKDKGLLESNFRENLRSVNSTVRDQKNLSTNQNMDFCRISTQIPENRNCIISSNDPLRVIPSKTPVSSNALATHAIEGPSNIMSSNRPIGGSFTSSFSKFFLGRSLNTTGKHAINESPEASDKSLIAPTLPHKTPLTVHNENMQGYLSREAYDTLMNENSLSSQLHSQEAVSKGPELPYYGINLREWLETNCFNASKNDKLCLFRKIVQVVDIEHAQGIALMELQPSSFIIFKTGDVKYIGSLMETELWSLHQGNTKKRDLEPEFYAHDNFHEKLQKVGEDKLVRSDTSFINQYSPDNIDLKNSCHSICNVDKSSVYEHISTRNNWLTSDNAQLEKKWYAFPEGFKIKDLLSSNIYSLGLMLFEFLCHFDSIEAHSAAMLSLNHRILPPCFLSENPEEAGFCFWLLHPEPSSRPTTRKILQSELIHGFDSINLSNDRASSANMMDDVESDLLLHFLVSLKQHMQNTASNLLQSMEFLDADLKVVESRQTCRKSLDMIGCYDFNIKDQSGVESPCSTSKINVLTNKLLGNISELENIYCSVRSNSQLTEMPNMYRVDKDVLTKRERLSWAQDPSSLPNTGKNNEDRVGMFFDGICKFACYNKFEVCGTMKNNDILNSNNVISSLSFDRDEQYIAAAGVSKKIKIFDVDSILDDSVDVQYPILEMSSKSKFSCICWNNHIKNYLVSTAYDGLVQMWDVNIGRAVSQYSEHQKRTWSVDFSRVDPMKFATGGDDCSLRIWNINEKNSISTIWNPANVCCVQFSSYSSHLVAFGSADYRIYCYDLRHTRIPWCTLTGHGNAVSFVKFLDSETIVSASIDNTLKLWDLNKTSLDGLSPNACSMTYKGHANEKNFVGLTVLDGYIACGSETNEVYAYYKSLPIPIVSHKFGRVDPLSGDENIDEDGHFVSSVCWRRKSQMLAASNSNGTIKILRMV